MYEFIINTLGSFLGFLTAFGLLYVFESRWEKHKRNNKNSWEE